MYPGAHYVHLALCGIKVIKVMDMSHLQLLSCNFLVLNSDTSPYLKVIHMTQTHKP